MLQKTDILFAHKALNIAADLSACDRRVAGAIIDHFNKKTGQCDPGIERLSILLGIDARTVKRATADLCGKHGLFRKVSHGGKSHRASYTPNWDRFAVIVAEWDARMSGKTRPPEAGNNGAEMPHSVGRNCPVKGGETAPQTLRRNQSKEPIQVEQVETQARNQDGRVVPERPSGLLRGSEREAKRTPPKVARSVAHRIAAEAAASRRWDAELRDMGWDAYGAVVNAITPEIADEATAAEMQRRGAGRQLILERLRLLHPIGGRRLQ